MPVSLPKQKTALVFLAIMALAVALRVLAFSLFDTIHHDEILQYQERAFRIVFGEGIVPWEQRYGIRNSLIPQLMAAPMWLAAQVSPTPYVPLLTARIVFAAVCLGAVPAAYFIGSLASRTHAIVAMLVVAVWFEAVLFGVSALSEAIATALALGGTAAILHARNNARTAFLTGFLLALMALARLQYAAYGAMLVILVARTDLALWRRIILGALPALALGAISDLAAGAVPYAWIVKNISMNITEGRASSYGVSGPLEYVRFFLLRAMPAGIVVLALAVLAPRQYRPVLWSALFLVVVHSFIAHKEYRFIHVAVMALIVLAAIGSVELAKRLRAGRTELSAMALATLCAGWVALSLFAYHRSGGEEAIRDGHRVAGYAVQAANLPETCGIAVAEDERKDLATVYMPRAMPLYLFPNPMNNGTKPFEPDALAAFNAVIVTGDAKLPESYRKVGCDTGIEADTGKPKRVCLLVRKGGCTVNGATKAYAYQQYYLDRNW